MNWSLKNQTKESWPDVLPNVENILSQSSVAESQQYTDKQMSKSSTTWKNERVIENINRVFNSGLGQLTLRLESERGDNKWHISDCGFANHCGRMALPSEQQHSHEFNVDLRRDNQPSGGNCSFTEEKALFFQDQHCPHVLRPTVVSHAMFRWAFFQLVVVYFVSFNSTLNHL